MYEASKKEIQTNKERQTESWAFGNNFAIFKGVRCKERTFLVILFYFFLNVLLVQDRLVYNKKIGN